MCLHRAGSLVWSPLRLCYSDVYWCIFLADLSIYKPFLMQCYRRQGESTSVGGHDFRKEMVLKPGWLVTRWQSWWVVESWYRLCARGWILSFMINANQHKEGSSCRGGQKVMLWVSFFPYRWNLQWAHMGMKGTVDCPTDWMQSMDIHSASCTLAAQRRWHN